MDRLNVELYAPPHSSAIENRVDESSVGCNQVNGEDFRVTRSCSSMGKSSWEKCGRVEVAQHGKQEKRQNMENKIKGQNHKAIKLTQMLTQGKQKIH